MARPRCPLRTLAGLAALGLLALGLGSPARASTPVTRGLMVGGISLGSEAAAGTVLALSGYGIGRSTCQPDATECLAPLIGGAAGGTLGVMIGAPLGGALAARSVHGRGGRVVAFTSIGLVTGLGIAFLALPTESGPLLEGGVIFSAVSMPVLAGVATATDRHANLARKPKGPKVSVLPSLRPGGAAVQVSVIGF